MLFTDVRYNQKSDYVFSNILTALVGRGEISGGRDLEAVISFGDNGLFVFMAHTHSSRLSDKDIGLLLRKRKLAKTSKRNAFFVSAYYIKKYLIFGPFGVLGRSGVKPDLAMVPSDLTFFDYQNKSICRRPADDWVKRLSSSNDFYRELPVTFKLLIRDNPDFSTRPDPFNDSTVPDNGIRQAIDLVGLSMLLSKNISLSSIITGKDFDDVRSKLALSVFLKSSDFSHRFLFSNDRDFFLEASALRQEALANVFDSNFIRYVRDLYIRDIKNYNFKNKWNRNFKPLLVPNPISKATTHVKRFSRSKLRSSYSVPFMFNFNGSLQQCKRLLPTIKKIKDQLSKSFEYTSNVYRNSGVFYSLEGPGDTFDLNLRGGLYETLRNYTTDINYRVVPMSLIELTTSVFSRFLFFKKTKRLNVFKVNKSLKALARLKIQPWRLVRSTRARRFKNSYYNTLKSSYIVDKALYVNRLAVLSLFNWRCDSSISTRTTRLYVKIDSLASFYNYTLPWTLSSAYSHFYLKTPNSLFRSYSGSCNYLLDSKQSLEGYSQSFTKWEHDSNWFNDVILSERADPVLSNLFSDCEVFSISSAVDLWSDFYYVSPSYDDTVELPCLTENIFDIYCTKSFFVNSFSDVRSGLLMSQHQTNSGALTSVFGGKLGVVSTLPTLSFLFNKNTDFLVRLQKRSVRSPSFLLWSHRLTLFSAALSGSYTRRHASQYLLASKTLINILMLKCFSRNERLFFKAPSWGWFGVNAFNPNTLQSVDISWVGSIKSPRKRLRSIKRRFAKRVVSKFGTRIAFSGVLNRSSSPSTRGV